MLKVYASICFPFEEDFPKNFGFMAQPSIIYCLFKEAINPICDILAHLAEYLKTSYVFAYKLTNCVQKTRFEFFLGQMENFIKHRFDQICRV